MTYIREAWISCDNSQATYKLLLIHSKIDDSRLLKLNIRAQKKVYGHFFFKAGERVGK